MRKDGFYVQMHMHTSQSSRCGHASGREMARAAREMGYGMICVTDHFINANINCDRDAAWEDKVEVLFRGYYDALEEGCRCGLRVLKGWETMTPTGGPEILTYGLSEEFLLTNPDIADVTLAEYVSRAKRAGAYLVHAHPYRKAPYIRDFVPDVTGLDAVEIWNAGHTQEGHPEYDIGAPELARAHGLPGTAGSDAHWPEALSHGAMRFEKELFDADDLFREIRAGRFEIVRDMQE